MKYLSKEKIENKRVLLRCDFNVPVRDGKIIDPSKIDKSMETINYLLENNNTVIILSHFGRVKSESDKSTNSLRVVYEYLKEKIDVSFINDPLKMDEINNGNSRCYLVENTRFTDVSLKRESANDLELAKYWSNFADAFVMDAFASLHRAHSSTAGISKYLPTYLGFLVERELNSLKPLITLEEKPFLVIMGGAKVDDKIKIIKAILEKCDKLVLTGGILNTFLKEMGFKVGKSLVSTDEEVLREVRDIIKNNQDKLLFSDEFVVERGGNPLKVNIKDIQDDDIIYDNLVTLEKRINDYKICFLNGTCGKYEVDDYAWGSKMLFTSLSKSNVKVYIGGGDSASAVNRLGFNETFEYISSGGGATLEYVAFNSLKALEYMKNPNNMS